MPLRSRHAHVWWVAGAATALMLVLLAGELQDPGQDEGPSARPMDRAATDPVEFRTDSADPRPDPDKPTRPVGAILSDMRKLDRQYGLADWYRTHDPSAHRIMVGSFNHPPEAYREILRLNNELCAAGLRSKGGMEQILDLLEHPEDARDVELMVRIMSPSQVRPLGSDEVVQGTPLFRLEESAFDPELTSRIVDQLTRAEDPWSLRALSCLVFLTMGWNVNPRQYEEHQIEAVIRAARAQEDGFVHQLLVGQLMHYVSQSPTAGSYLIGALDLPAQEPLAGELVMRLTGGRPGQFIEGQDDETLKARSRLRGLHMSMSGGLDPTSVVGVEFISAILAHPNSQGREWLRSGWAIPPRGLPDEFYEGKTGASATLTTRLMGVYDEMDPPTRRAILNWLAPLRTQEAAAFVEAHFQSEYLAIPDEELSGVLDIAGGFLSLSSVADGPSATFTVEHRNWELLLRAVAGDPSRDRVLKQRAIKAVASLVMLHGLDRAASDGARQELDILVSQVALSPDADIRSFAEDLRLSGLRELEELESLQALLRGAADR